MNGESPAAPSLLGHSETVFGLNYWFDHNFVLKGSFHLVDGNLFAGPDDEEFGQVLLAGTLDDRTNLFLIGAQFSF